MKTVIYLKNRGILSQVINESEFKYFNWEAFKKGEPVYVDTFEAIFEARITNGNTEIITLTIE